MTQLDRTTPDVGTIPEPRRPLEPWTPTPPSGIRWLDVEPPAPPAPTRSFRGGAARWLAAAVVALVAAGGAAAVLTSGLSTMTVQGSVTAAVSGATLPGAPCTASRMSSRAASIWSSDGTLLATATLPRTGYAVDRWGTRSPFGDGCRFDVLFTDVPAADTDYRVGVGRSAADGERFSRDELVTAGASITYGR